MKKYELTDEKIELFGRKLFRIKALKSFGNVKKGELGGYVEKEENLDQTGNAWVGGNAEVHGNAEVRDDAEVCSEQDVLCVGPIGSRNGTTTFFKTKKKEIGVKCGCFRGSIDEFERKVESTHGTDTKYAKQYKAAIELAKTTINI